MNALRLTAIAAMVAASFAAHADPAKPTPRTLTVKEATIEARRQVQELADRLRESDRKAVMGGVVIDGLYSAGASGTASSGNGAGKR